MEETFQVTPERAKAEIADLKNAIENGSTTVNDNNQRVGDEFILDLVPFFDGRVDRTKLPAFSGNKVQSYPDPTLGGISSDTNPANGTPDLVDWATWNEESEARSVRTQ